MSLVVIHWIKAGDFLCPLTQKGGDENEQNCRVVGVSGDGDDYRCFLL